MTSAPIKTAVIGFGFSAKTFHIPFITSLPDFELSAISTSKTDDVRQQWPQTQPFASAEELLEQSDADLVIITAPNDVHFTLAKKALENDKHVILEKPFVTNSSEGKALIELAEKKQRVLSVYHNRRWDGDFLTVKKLIEENQIGEVKCFESHFDRFRPQVRQRWREQASVGGGILFDLGSHLIDQAVYLFGVPNALTAQCEIMREGSTNIDYFHVVLHYPEHLAILHGDLYSAGPNKRFSVKGTKGSYEKYGLDPQEERLIAGVLPITDDWSEETDSQYGTFYNMEDSERVKTQLGCYQNYFSEMAKAIRGEQQPPVAASDALKTIELIELAMESSRLGKTLTVAE